VESQRFVGQVLVSRGALPAERLDELLKTADEKNVALLDLLGVQREVEPNVIVRALADEVGVPFLEKIRAEDVPASLVEKIPITFARQHRLLGLSEEGETGPVRVAVANPLDPAPLDDLRALLGRPIVAVAATSDAIEDAINRVYERKDETALREAKEGQEVEELQDLLDMTDEAPVIRWVNNLFYNAVRDRASDIHIEANDKEVVVRYRIDGDLYPVKTAHKGFHPSIVSRVKIEAGLNIAEKRLPQDGRITKKIQGRLIDVRVSTIPNTKGERIVMRLLDKEKVLLDLTDLGYSGPQLEVIQHLITRPNGILLVTGPTGSGKTTTLYACLARINRPDLNILTAEDPVEYELRGIGQLHVQPKIGLTFANALRSFLRQDPDVIMVGEIRDHETAEIAIHASLTGHLVLSTIHTNDAAGAVTRLAEMDVENYLITSSLIAVIAQRLVRRLCPHCRQAYEPSDEDLRQLGVERDRLAIIVTTPGIQPVAGFHWSGGSAPEGADLGGVDDGVPDLSDALEPEDVPEAPTRVRSFDDVLREKDRKAAFRQAVHAEVQSHVDGLQHARRPRFYNPVGCEHCASTGYRGRVAIAEILIIDDPVRKEILNRSDAGAIQRAATTRGMRTLREDGARMVLLGVTSLAEVLAATQASELTAPGGG
jgi:general secretion pathway protein E